MTKNILKNSFSRISKKKIQIAKNLALSSETWILNYTLTKTCPFYLTDLSHATSNQLRFFKNPSVMLFTSAATIKYCAQIGFFVNAFNKKKCFTQKG